jgi:uncharacterized membrane protein YGL010W
MRSTTELLSHYASHHRDHRNIVSHFIGIPAVIFALGVLLARPSFALGSLTLSPAWLMFAVATAWYLTRGSMLLGVACSVGVATLLSVAEKLAHGSVMSWLAWGLGAFIVGRLLQFLGHCYEGDKRRHASDLRSMLVGPLFLTAQALFVLGWNKSLMADIERHAGPVVLRDMARIA